jgi:hypothetical protein
MKAYTNTQRYVIGTTVYRAGNKITSFDTPQIAEDHASNLNRQFGDQEAYELLNSIRNELTLYEDGEFMAEAVLESIKAMLDSREK